MNILLYLPGLLLVLVKLIGVYGTIRCLSLIFGVQVLVALPLLQHDPKAYLSNAFEMSRVFLYRWTVNWRFVPENVFLSRQFASLLLATHLIVLVAFGLVRWCRRDGGAFAVIKRAFRQPNRPAAIIPIGSSGVPSFLRRKKGSLG